MISESQVYFIWSIAPITRTIIMNGYIWIFPDLTSLLTSFSKGERKKKFFYILLNKIFLIFYTMKHGSSISITVSGGFNFVVRNASLP